jgi:hypothetical protein
MAPKKLKEMFSGDASCLALEKLADAVHELAMGSGHLQDRIYKPCPLYSQ